MWKMFPTEFRLVDFYMKFAFLLGWNRNFRPNFSIFVPEDVNENVWPVDPQGIEESEYSENRICENFPRIRNFIPNKFVLLNNFSNERI